MTTSELKQQIEKVLGNSIRCLLPSYWWKRIFGLVLDAIEKLPDKQYVDKAVGNVKVVTDTVMSDTSTNAVQNKVIKQYVDNNAGSCVVYFPIAGGTLTAEQIGGNAASYQRLDGTNLISEVLVWSLLGYTKALTVVAGTNGITIATASSHAVLHEDGSVTDYVEQPSTLTFVAAFNSALTDTTTELEMASNKANAQIYYNNLLSGKEKRIDLRFLLRDENYQYGITVHPSYAGSASLYNVQYKQEYGDDAMVFAKLDLGVRYAGLICDLILTPDNGFELVPHVEANGVNLIHARLESGVISSEYLSTTQLWQNRAVYKWGSNYPVALYISNEHQLIPATLSNNVAYLTIYAGDYTFRLNSDGTVEAVA